MPLWKNSIPSARSLQSSLGLHCALFLAFPPLIFRLQRAYGDACMGASSVRRWIKYFKDGNTSTQNQPYSDRPRTASTEHNKERGDAIIRDDSRVTVSKIAAKLGIEHNAVQEMIVSFGQLERSSFAKAFLNCQNDGKIVSKEMGTT